MPEPEIDDPILGRLRQHGTFGFYEGAFESGGQTVSITLHTDENGDIAPALDRARRMVPDCATLSKAAEDYHLVTELLHVKNEGWLDDEEEPLTPEQFKARLALGSIEFAPDGFVSFYYDCDEMFTDHCLMVMMDDAGQFIAAGVEG
jgi:hypothetical protein